MKRVLQIIGLLALAGLLYFGWITFFPGDEVKIRRLLGKLAETTSFSADQGSISDAFAVDELIGCLTPEVEVHVEVPGEGSSAFNGRHEIRQTAMGVRTALRQGLKVELLDPVVAMAAGKESATVELTAKITLSGEREFFVQELKLQLKKLDGDWLVSRVDTVRTISR